MRRFWRCRGPLVVFFLCLACSDDSAPSDVAGDCSARYSPADGFGYGDPVSAGVLSPDAGISAGDAGAPTLDAAVAAEAACGSATGENAAADGSKCDRARFMTQRAALCVASSLDFDEGIEEVVATLSYNPRLHRVIWSLRNTTSVTNNGRNGQWLDLDAVTGEQLGRGEWSGS